MPTVEFESALALETLLRAAVLFKFEGGGESEIYAGSPHFAQAVNRLLEGVVQDHRRSAQSSAAERWENLYKLAGHEERRNFVRDYARRHPNWTTMGDRERREWIDIVAAPYEVAESDYKFLLG